MARKTVGIRRLGDSYEVYGHAAGHWYSRRFPLDTPLSVMRVWRRERAHALRLEHPRAKAGSLQEAVSKFLKLETGRRHDDFEDLLGHWVRAFEDKSRVLLTSAEVQRVLDEWKVAGVAASTLNHRRQALRTMFRRLEPDLPNPVDRTKPYKQPVPEPRAVPEDVLDKVFDAMPDSATKARLLAICHTGMRHSELMRVRPEDITWDGQPQVFVRSGKGGRHRVVPLNERAVGAMMAMHLYAAWGAFSQASARKTWLSACRKAGVPAGLYRPYDLRHRFATRLRERGADLADVQELLGHKDIRTTSRYAPVVHAKLVTVVNALVEDSSNDYSRRTA